MHACASLTCCALLLVHAVRAVPCTDIHSKDCKACQSSGMLPPKSELSARLSTTRLERLERPGDKVP
jgi:hypothetical protein